MLATLAPDMALVGGVTDSEADVWIRTDESAVVTIEYSTDPSFTSSTITGPIVTAKNRDFTATFELNGLASDTTYYYRVLLDGVVHPSELTPSFTTFAPAGESQEVTFAVTADLANILAFPTAGAPAYSALAAEDPDFVLQIGDFDHRNPSSLGGLLRMHRDVRSPDTAAGADFATYIAANFPFYHVWDDHDYGINNGDKTHPYRDFVIDVFQAYYPLPDQPNPEGGLWHSIEDAQVEVFVLDTRSQRDPNTEPDGPDKSMLDGDNIANGQKDWLFDGLLNSTATWKIVVSSVPFNPTTKPQDSWGAFMTEHDEVVQFVSDNQISGVVIISGDLHSGGAIDDGTNSGLVEVSVPATNPTWAGAYSGPPGTWSQSLFPGGAGNGGYVLVRALTDPDQLVLEIYGEDGTLRDSIVLTPEDTLPTLAPQAVLQAEANTGPSSSTETTIVSQPISQPEQPTARHSAVRDEALAGEDWLYLKRRLAETRSLMAFHSTGWAPARRWVGTALHVSGARPL